MQPVFGSGNINQLETFVGWKHQIGCQIPFPNAQTGNTFWTNDDITLNGTVVSLPADPANPTSNSPQCSSPGVIITATGTPPAGETWYWQSSAAGTSTANAAAANTVTSSGTYYVRSQDNTTLRWSLGAGRRDRPGVSIHHIGIDICGLFDTTRIARMLQHDFDDAFGTLTMMIYLF